MTKSILVPIDFSDVTDILLAEARRLAKSLNAKLWLFHVATSGHVYTNFEAEIGLAFPRDDVASDLRHEHRLLQEYEAGCHHDALAVTSMLVKGKPGRKIVEESQRLRPILIALGSHGHGALHHLLMGSVCEYVMQHATCPIMIVPSRVGAYVIETDTKEAGVGVSADSAVG